MNTGGMGRVEGKVKRGDRDGGAGGGEKVGKGGGGTKSVGRKKVRLGRS